MTRPVSKAIISSLVVQAAIFICLALGMGCSPNEGLSLVEEDLIAAYIEDVEKAQNLFRVDGVFPDNEFKWPGSEAIYRDSVMEVTRTIDIFVTDTAINYTNHSVSDWVLEGVAHVTDEFSIRTFRTDTNGTTSFDEIRTLVRNGFFLKLESDNAPYAGWELWGFGPGNISDLNFTVGIQVSGGPSLRGDYDFFDEKFKGKGMSGFGKYIRLSEMPMFTDSVELMINATISSNNIPTRFKPSIIRSTAAGHQTKPMQKIDLEHFIDTISIQPYNDPIYDFLMFRLATEKGRYFHKVWVIPYRALSF